MGEEFSPSTFLRAHIGDTPSKAARMNRMHFAYWNQGENNIMKQKALEAMAADDAKRWAAAEMFYGEGAGTRRKLLNAELGERFDDPVYNELFNNAYDKLDLNKFAQQAIKERKSIDRAAKAGRNFRAIKSGNLGNLSTGVFVVVGVAYVAHQTGYDKVALAEAKKVYKKAKVEVKIWKARREGRNVERIA